MGQVADGSNSAAAAPASEPEAGESSNEPQPRGFFGRILGALGASPGEADPSEAQSATSAAAALGLPGLGNLRKMRVGDVAVPKAEIVAVPVTTTREELVEVFRTQGYSRLPVFKDTLDSPMGLVHLKDLALAHGFGGAPGRFSLRKLLRPLLYVPPSMPIGVLLQKMQLQRIHMALVIDEYGGVDGLVTLEDLIEQVIGEIEDEHDEEEDGLWKLEKPGQWLVQARTPLTDFEAEIGMKLADAEEGAEIDTLGGLVFMQIDRVPTRGEVIVAENGVEFEVVDADPRRVKRLRVRLPGVAAE
ncbi:transporter associated domain-containing protein [Rhodobacter capsulatus]|uniref:Magnesium and cobalt transporter n=1 Tax=Rhodobacter capsulatus TaxID=1061 RepID=A0A1G7P1E5_RHOCA|nr:transporter associated domain-containing protein [Rhodobacter capsulatus]WER08340.1 transporter associated domain-containing protein [Rhodobacter capsulatus]SDF80125.1 magnesium and cobalt transporter [Rhodobacter capsulatus]